MPVQSLHDLSKQRLIQNIDMLTDIGDLPYSFLAPILRHIENPSQLLELEQNCPQIVGETGEIWLRFIKRDIPSWDEKPHQPRDPKNWSKVYRKLKKDAEREKAEQEEALKKQMRDLQQSRAGNQTLIVEGKTGYNPAAIRRGFGFRGSGGSGSWGSSAPPPPSKTGKMAFDKLRRSVFDQKQARPKATQIPTHLLNERKNIIKQAPARLVRMNENEGPKSMVISKQASASVASKSSDASRPNIISRPIPEQGSSAKKPQRPSLPAGRQFTAPKLQPQQSAPTAVPRRKREEPSIFHQPKRRKL